MMTILFDLDGTLTDPYIGISRCINHAMEQIGRPLPDGIDHRPFIGPPLQGTFLELCGDAEKATMALTAYRERFAGTGLYENEVYSGVPEMLERLASHRLYICTSKPTSYATRIIEHFGLTEHFVRIYGSEMDGTRADKAELVAWLLEQEGLSPDRCLMVGDRSHDIIAGAKNGVSAVGALWGYGTEDELLKAGADALAESPTHLATWVLSWNGENWSGRRTLARWDDRSNGDRSTVPPR